MVVMAQLHAAYLCPLELTGPHHLMPRASPRTRDDSPGAEAFLPRRRTLESLRKAALGCKGCPLFARATQTVFGHGPRTARMLLVGEQPGDEEDRAGLPFVGPAGRLLDQAMAAAGIDRDAVYLTNVVKHFKWQPRGKRRMHSKPDIWEIRACLAWLQQEIALIEPRVLVCLGATAAQALFAPTFRISRARGELVASALAPHALATWHPSAVLRQRTAEARAQHLQMLIDDLRLAATFV